MKKAIFALLIFIQTAAIPSFVVAQKGRAARISRPPELRGSKEQRMEQNTKAINLGINQVETDQELLTLVENKDLAEFIAADYYVVDRGMSRARKLRRGKKTIICQPKENKVFAYAFAVSYIDLLTRDFFQEFRKKLKITSGARSLEEHILMRTRGSCYYDPNAALADNPLEESLHIRGIAVDISRRVVAVVKGKLKETPMSRKEVNWMRNRLIADKFKGIEFEIEPIEENAGYHIVVFPKTN